MQMLQAKWVKVSEIAGPRQEKNNNIAENARGKIQGAQGKTARTKVM